MHIMSGKCFSGIVDTAMSDVYLENLKYATEKLSENGIVGLIEPISPQGIPNYFMNSFKTGRQIFCSLQLFDTSFSCTSCPIDQTNQQ